MCKLNHNLLVFSSAQHKNVIYRLDNSVIYLLLVMNAVITKSHKQIVPSYLNFTPHITYYLICVVAFLIQLF